MFFSPITQLTLAIKALNNSTATANSAAEMAETLKKIEEQNNETLRRIEEQQRRIQAAGIVPDRVMSPAEHIAHEARRIVESASYKYYYGGQ